MQLSCAQVSAHSAVQAYCGFEEAAQAVLRSKPDTIFTSQPSENREKHSQPSILPHEAPCVLDASLFSGKKDAVRA